MTPKEKHLRELAEIEEEYSKELAQIDKKFKRKDKRLKIGLIIFIAFAIYLFFKSLN